MFRWTGIVAGLTAVLLASGGCSRKDGERFARATDRFDVRGARLVVALPAQGRLLDEFLTLVVNVEGTEGVLDLVKAASGVDLSDEGLLAHAGLDPSFAPLLFVYRDCPVLVAGLADERTFLAFVETTAARIGITPTRVRTDSVDLYLLPSGLAYAVEGNLAVFLDRPAGLAMETLAALLLEPRGEGQEPFPDDRVTVRIVRAEGTAGSLAAGHWGQEDLADCKSQIASCESKGMAPDARSEELAASAGPLAGVVRAFARFLDSCRQVDIVVIPGDRYRFSLALTGGPLPFVAGGNGEPEALVPEDAVVLMQAALPGDTLWGVLSPVWQALVRAGLRQVKGKLPDAYGDPALLLGRFEPRFSVAFLGLSPIASVDTFAKARTPADPFFALHLELLLTLREGATLDDLLAPEAVEALAGEVEETDLSSGDLRGKELCREDEKTGRRCVSVLSLGKEVLLVTGAGEGPRLARTVLGQRKRLSEALFVERRRGPLTVTLKTRRLVRDLMSKGFPPYFLQVLSSILELRVTATTQGEVTRLEGEVVLR
ncbi:MAG: hypothetical protein FJ109_08900 [Deltaproteobacteria bacterium]|nr:hypothetical protein [Deltaproteobacteria bacterium]